jgi:hypothetical protein
MKWMVKLERIDEAGNFHSATVGHIERTELTFECDLGLTHDDGKFIFGGSKPKSLKIKSAPSSRKFGPLLAVDVSVPSRTIGGGGSTLCLDISAFMRLASKPALAGVLERRLQRPRSFRIVLRRN